MDTYITIDTNGFLGEIKAISWDDAECQVKDNPNTKVHGKLFAIIDEYTGERIDFDKIAQN